MSDQSIDYRGLATTIRAMVETRVRYEKVMHALSHVTVEACPDALERHFLVVSGLAQLIVEVHPGCKCDGCTQPWQSAVVCNQTDCTHEKDRHEPFEITAALISAIANSDLEGAKLLWQSIEDDELQAKILVACMDMAVRVRHESTHQ